MVMQHYFSQSFDKNCIALLTRNRKVPNDSDQNGYEAPGLKSEKKWSF